MEHQYSLKWNNHPNNISSVFSRLRSEELFVDVTLATMDKQTLRAHRMVLSAGSGYLEEILALNPSDHPTIVLSTISHKQLQLLVDFMYTGEISVDQPLLGGLLEAANWLQIKGLYERPEESARQTTESPLERVKSPEPESISRKRQWSAGSEACSESTEPPPQYSPPYKSAKQVYGVSNAGWIVDNLKEKLPEEETKFEKDVQDIPNLLNLANQQSFMQQIKTESPIKPVLDPSLNEKMLQAMQLCGPSYLSQLAVLQNCTQSKPLSAFTGSFTSFPPNNAFPPASKPGILSSAPVRRYKQYTEDSLHAALKEIMEGQSINRSSMKHNIPARTLRDWMKRLNIKSVYTHHNGKDKEGSIGSNSPEPDISMTLSDRFRLAAAAAGSTASVNTSTEIEIDDDDESESGPLKIDEGCHNLHSVAEMAA